MLDLEQFAEWVKGTTREEENKSEEEWGVSFVKQEKVYDRTSWADRLQKNSMLPYNGNYGKSAHAKHVSSWS